MTPAYERLLDQACQAQEQFTTDELELHAALLHEADRAAHAAALKGDDQENAVQLRRMFHLRGAYQGEAERCGTCAAYKRHHPAVHYDERMRGTCSEWRAP